MTIKEQVCQLVEQLPENASWEDLRYEIDVRRKTADGLKDGDEGRVVSHEEVNRRFQAG